MGSNSESLPFAISLSYMQTSEKKNLHKNVQDTAYLYVKPLFCFVILDEIPFQFYSLREALTV